VKKTLIFALLMSTSVFAQTAKREIPVPSVMVTSPMIKSMSDQFTFSGTLVARDEALIFPEIEGLRITNLLVEEGDRVKKGQTLLRLNDEQLQISLKQAEAGRDKAKAGLEQAKNNILLADAAYDEARLAYDRAKALLERKDIAPAVFDQRNAAYLSAKTRVASSKDGLNLAAADLALIEAQMNDVKLRLTRAEIKAPVDGIISRRTAKIGQLASMLVPEPLFRLISNGLVELEGDVLETRLAKLKPGQRVTVGDGVQGEIRLVPSEVSAATRLGRVRVSLPPDASLKVGAFARAVVSIESREGLTLPSSAININDDTTTDVQTVVGGKIMTKKVKTGIKANGLTEIREGLSANDIIVVRSGPFLRDGDAVKPITEGVK
jgi:HlyD family secretion protein